MNKIHGMTHIHSTMDHGRTAAYSPHISRLRVIMLLILSSRRRDMRTLPPELWNVVFMTYFASGRMATASRDGVVTIYDLDVRRVERRWTSHQSCDACVLMPAQSIVVTAHLGHVSLWDMDTGDFVARHDANTCFYACRGLPDQNVLFVISTEPLLYKWHIDRTTQPMMELVSRISTTLKFGNCSAINADGTLLAIGDCQGQLEIWNTEPLQRRHVYNLNVLQCVFHFNTLYLACSCVTQAVYRVELDRVAQAADQVAQAAELVIQTTEPMRSFALSPDGRHSVIATKHYLQIRNSRFVWNIWYSPMESDVHMWHCSFSPTGAYLVALASNGRPYIWAVSGDVFTAVLY
jgi:WD40 repeat protein